MADRSYQDEDGEMNRNNWEFEYTARMLADAAQQQKDYRLSRVTVWEGKKAEVMARIKESGITVHESVADKMTSYTVSNMGRNGPQITIDTTMQRDLSECAEKIQTHRQAATEYDGWIQMLNDNPEDRVKLKHNDWMYFFGK